MASKKQIKNCKHRWHYVVCIDNPANICFGYVRFICDKCGEVKHVFSKWIKQYDN